TDHAAGRRNGSGTKDRDPLHHHARCGGREAGGGEISCQLPVTRPATGNRQLATSMYPWRRILIPTDFSTASEWAFDDAIRIAGSTSAELLILHIRITRTSQPEQLRFPAGDAVYDYAEQQELQNLRERVKR